MNTVSLIIAPEPETQSTERATASPQAESAGGGEVNDVVAAQHQTSPATPIQELPPPPSPVDAAEVTVPVTDTEAAPVPIDQHMGDTLPGTLSEEAEQVPADVYDMGNIPAFLDRRKPSAVDYLASG